MNNSLVNYEIFLNNFLALENRLINSKKHDFSSKPFLLAKDMEYSQTLTDLCFKTDLEKTLSVLRISLLREAIENWIILLERNSRYCYDLGYKGKIEYKIFADLKNALFKCSISSSMAVGKSPDINFKNEYPNNFKELIIRLKNLKEHIAQYSYSNNFFIINELVNSFRLG